MEALVNLGILCGVMESYGGKLALYETISMKF